MLRFLFYRLREFPRDQYTGEACVYNLNYVLDDIFDHEITYTSAGKFSAESQKLMDRFIADKAKGTPSRIQRIRS